MTIPHWVETFDESHCALTLTLVPTLGNSLSSESIGRPLCLVLFLTSRPTHLDLHLDLHSAEQVHSGLRLNGRLCENK